MLLLVNQQRLLLPPALKQMQVVMVGTNGTITRSCKRWNNSIYLLLDKTGDSSTASTANLYQDYLQEHTITVFLVILVQQQLEVLLLVNQQRLLLPPA
jgi:hypothetical protein